MNVSDLIKVYKECADSGDPWGSAMGAWFTVSNELYFRGVEIPGSWNYSPGAIASGADPREPDDYMYEVCCAADSPTLLRFGDVLCKYTTNLSESGFSY